MRVAIIILGLLVLCDSVQGQPLPDLSFKGLRLGMTRREVDQLVKNTKWAYYTVGYKHRYVTTDAPDTTRYGYTELTIEDSTGVWDFNTSNDSLAIIGCRTANGYTDCESFNSVTIQYADSIIYSLRIYSSDVESEYPATLENFAEMAITAVTNKYGKPTKTGTTDYSESQLILLGDNKIVRAAQWQWPIAAKKAKPAREININLDKRPTDYSAETHYDYHIVIELIDHDRERLREEQIQRENEQYFENEKKAKVKTDF